MDANKIIDKLIHQDGMTELDAQEFFDYNISGVKVIQSIFTYQEMTKIFETEEDRIRELKAIKKFVDRFKVLIKSLTLLI